MQTVETDDWIECPDCKHFHLDCSCDSEDEDHSSIWDRVDMNINEQKGK